MSQPSLKGKFDDEQFLSTAFAVELEDAKKTSAQLTLEKQKPIHGRSCNLNVEYCIEKVSKKEIVLHPDYKNQKQQNNPAIGTFTRLFGNLKTFRSLSITQNYLKKQKT